MSTTMACWDREISVNKIRIHSRACAMINLGHVNILVYKIARQIKTAEAFHQVRYALLPCIKLDNHQNTHVLANAHQCQEAALPQVGASSAAAWAQLRMMPACCPGRTGSSRRCRPRPARARAGQAHPQTAAAAPPDPPLAAQPPESARPRLISCY